MFDQLESGSRVEAPALVLQQPVPEDSFPKQWDYVTSLERFNVVCCSRQCGKTWGARLRTRLIVAHPKKRVLYLTLIKDNARDYFWRPLLQELQEAHVPHQPNDTRMEFTFPNGSFVKAKGCEDLRGAGKVRGGNWDLIIIDEAQEPHDEVLQTLVDQVIVPQMATRGGSVDMLGTPPDSLAGYFVDAVRPPDGAPDVWAHFGWTMFDNRFIPRASIEALVTKRGLTPDHPVYKREFLGQLEVDPSKLAYEYDPARNDYDPKDLDLNDPDWVWCNGLDLGFSDSDAHVLGCYKRTDPQRRLYAVDPWAENHLDVDALSAKLKSRWRQGTSVGDHGGHGAVKVLATLQTRLGIRFWPKPQDVMLSVGLVNDDLRTGRLLIPRGSRLAKELLLVTKRVNPTTKKVEINKQGFHSDLTEALRYMHHAARHWASKAPAEAPKEEDWAQQMRDRRRLQDERMSDPW